MGCCLNEKVKVSIIIPHYNSSNLLRRLLKSIPENDAIEIIVVDDKSNMFLDELRDCQRDFPYVKFFVNDTKNKGAGVSRNIGIEKSSGEWLLFADADDYFIPEMFDLILKQTNSKDVDIIYFNPTSINQNGKTGKRHIEFSNYLLKFAKEKNSNNLNNLKYRFTPPWSKLIRKNIVIENAIHFGGGRCAEDVMFSCESAYYAKNIKVCCESIYCITESENSMTASADEDKNMTFSMVMIERYDFLKKRLSKKEMRELDISSLGRIYLTIKSDMKIKTKIRHIVILIKSGMPIIPKKIWSLKFWKVRFAGK